ncbi:MAG: hypothetical protein ACI4XM_08905 [Candidatus Coprovivens sp.]
MKNIIKEIITFTLISLYFYYIITNNQYIKEQTIYSVNIWLTKIIPSLFPTFILVDLIYNSKIPYYIEKYLHINFIYILSIISGSPSNAYMLNKYQNNITKHLSVTKYTSLIFTYTYLKAIYKPKIAIIIIGLNILSNIILILIIKPKKLKYNYNKQTNILNTIISSIKNNTSTLITILGTIIFFNTLPITLIKNKYLKSVILSILEITTSLENIKTTTLPIKIKILLTIISLSTCGLCIETQIKSIINDTQINYNKYLLYRMIHLILFLSLTIITISIL